MAIKKIVTSRSELSKKTTPINFETDKELLNQIITDLRDTLKEKKGFGLSANQIGYDKSVAIMNTTKGELILINPEIASKTDKIKVKNESCLSFSGIYVNTIRYTNVVAYNYNEKGEENTIMLSDINATVFLHEFDHLNGILLFQRKG